MGSKKQFTPAAKLSKKKRQALAKAQRVTWAFSPVTRRRKNKKAYDRNQLKRSREHAFPPDLFLWALRSPFAFARRPPMACFAPCIPLPFGA